MIWLVAVLLSAVTTTVNPRLDDATAEVDLGVRGTLRSAGNREPISNARVMAVPAGADEALGRVSTDELLQPGADPPQWVVSSESDASGHFVFESLASRRVRLVIIAEGHERTEFIVDTSAISTRGLTVFVPRDEEAEYRTVIEAPVKREAGHVTSTVLSEEEIRTAPGTQGDPLRALQNLPGVARSPGGLGILVLRGASPNQSRVFLGGHALPRAFHSLALASVVPAAAIDRMEFLPGNFGSRYGDATGGVVVLHPAQMERRGIHGHGRVDLLGAGAATWGPLGEGTFLVAAQRGWVDGVLKVAERVDPTESFVLPRYYDYQAFFDHPVGRRAQLSARVLGAGDVVQTRGVAPFDPAQRPKVLLELGSQFHRADLSYRVRHGHWSFWLTPSFRFERNTVFVSDLRRTNIRNDLIVSGRVEATRGLTRRASITLGADAEIDRYGTGLRIDSAASYPGMNEPFEHGVQTSIGTYAQMVLRLGKWELFPGLRVSGFSLGGTTKAALDPRVSARWSFAPRWHWSMGVGLYSQARVVQQSAEGNFIGTLAGQLPGYVVLPAAILSFEPRAGFAPLDGALFLARAAQASTAIGRELGDSWYLELGAWARIRDNADGIQYRFDGSPEVVTSTWSDAYGVEFLARRKLGPKLWGWVGYTLSRAESRILDQVGPPSRRDRVPTDFDQRHNLVALASYQLPRRWRIGGRFRLVSGSPFTDILGPLWAPDDRGVYPINGAINGSRFPIFHQLDVRVDKTWVLRRASMSAYVDVQNVYNRINPEAYIYEYDLYHRNEGVGLPIFPSLGFRVDF